ncbi:MAG: acyltransferase domain-containing protein [bacterium]|nr:acyltransferase domain-containing protein [bacterium]
MTAEDVAKAINEADMLEGIAPFWEEAMAVMPAGLLPFLDPAAVIENRQWGGLEDSLDAPLLATAAYISADEALRCLAWYCYWHVFETGRDNLAMVPALKTLPGDMGSLFYLLIGMAMVPRLREYHRTLRIPEEITRTTAGQISCICGNYRRAHAGRPGVFIKQLAWLRHYINGNIYLHIGRFEYWLAPFRGGVTVYRHRDSGETIALAEAGQEFSRSGYLNGDITVPGDESAWVSTLNITGSEVRGYPVLPQGHGLRQEICLPLAEWEPVLKRGDWVLDIHIPAGGGMPPEACRDSLQQAADFFRKRFPERSPAAFCTVSWIFSPQLEQVLPQDSNMVKLQRELYLYPWPSISQSVWFIFFQNVFDPATAPRDTSLQRAVYDYLVDNRYWRNQAMFFLLDDLPEFGRQVYRSRVPAIVDTAV